jgi:hypothetical protein
VGRGCALQSRPEATKPCRKRSSFAGDRFETSVIVPLDYSDASAVARFSAREMTDDGVHGAENMTCRPSRLFV